MENVFNGHMGRFGIDKEGFSGLEDKFNKNSLTEIQRGKKKKGKNLITDFQELWDSFQKYNVNIIRIPGEK